MKRTGVMAIAAALTCFFSLPATSAGAQSASPGVGTPQVVPNLPAPRRQPQARLRITPYYEPEGVYPHYNPGPNAVRVCNATYVQEYRPSGTVIVPRMTCYWTH